MHLPKKLILAILATAPALVAETVILTTVPDETRTIQPLTSLGGIPLGADTQVRLGAFPSLGNAALLDMAATGGVAAVETAFTPFGGLAAVGQGVGGAAGGFEVSFRDLDASGLAGEVVSLFLKADGGEFLVARFQGEHFSAITDTGVEPLRALHMADAVLVVGSRIGDAVFSTAPTPTTGSYASWIAGFSSITDPAMRVATADADGDGRTNLLEYATGGDPTDPGDAPVCEILPDGEGGFWVLFRRVPGIGSLKYHPQSSANLLDSWTDESTRVAPDPGNPAFLRLHLPLPLPPAGFHRLLVE